MAKKESIDKIRKLLDSDDDPDGEMAIEEIISKLKKKPTVH